MPDFLPQHLVAKIWASIYYQCGCSRLNQNTGTKAFVFFISGSADFTFASDHGYAAAGAAAKKCYFKRGITHRIKVRNTMKPVTFLPFLILKEYQRRVFEIHQSGFLYLFPTAESGLLKY